MSIADELAKLEELRRQRVISNEEFAIAKKKVLSDDDAVIHAPQNEGDASGELSSLDLVTRKPEHVASVDIDRFSTQCEVGDALDEMAERELEADQQRIDSDHRGRSRSREGDRDLLGEIYSLDRQWDLKRESYKMRGQDGHEYTPTKGGSVVMGVMVVVFGTFWTAMAASMGGGVGPSLFPLFGLFIIGIGIVLSIASYKKAENYERAQRTYRQRRRDLENKRR